MKRFLLPRRASLTLVLFALSIWPRPVAGGPPSGFGADRFTPFYFVHASDPHLSDPDSIKNFRRIGAQVNPIQAPLVILSGDLGVYTKPQDWSGFDACIDAFAMPIKPIPGNHDVTSRTTTLPAYRAHFSNDYYTFVYNNCAFLCLNSITLIDRKNYPGEYDAQWAWIPTALAEARKARRERIFIQIHHAPYLNSEDEAPDYFAMPPPERARLLDLARIWQVDAIFAGHAHRNYNHPTANPPLFVLAGSFSNFTGESNGGLGYNLFRVTAQGLDRIYIGLDAPPDLTLPQTPYPLQAAQRTSATVTLTWPHPGDDTGVLKYRLLRDGVVSGEAVGETWTDDVRAGESHRYGVQALDASGNASAASNQLTVAAADPGVRDLLLAGSGWRVLESATPPGAMWMLPTTDDSAWRFGFAQFGYGEGDETTTVSYGSDPKAKRITTWFRGRFDLASLSGLRAPTLRVLCEDGAVVYLNGIEAGRWGMPEGAVNPTTRALRDVTGAARNAWHELALPTSLLKAGTNVFAVEVHVADPAAVSLGFDLQLADSTLDDPAILTRGPYLQKPGPTAITVRWRTEEDAVSRVSWGTQPGEARWRLTDLTPRTEHELRLNDLTPGTRYDYKVEAGLPPLSGGDAETFFSTPPPATADPFARIWVLGDSGTGGIGPGPGADAAAVRDGFYRYTAARNPDLMLMLGDNAYYQGTDEQYQHAIFEMYPDTLRNTPLWPTLGNHDAYSVLPGTSVHPYYSIFTLPMGGECGGAPSGSEAYYSFDYGCAHFICLDSMESDRSTTGTMLGWLKRDLAASAGARWTIAYWHHPPYSKGAHNSDLAGNEGINQIELRERALPILEAAGVDLVLTGHSHSYERSYLIDGHYGYSWTFKPSMILNAGDGRIGGDGPYLKPAAARTPNAGTVYAVVGNSGLLTTGGDLNHPAMVRSMMLLGSLVVDVHTRKLDARMIDVNGAVRDEFTIWKGTPTAAGDGWRRYR